MPHPLPYTLRVRSLRSLPLPLSLRAVLGGTRSARSPCVPSSSVRESTGFPWGIGGLSPAPIPSLLRRSTPPYSRSLTLAPTAPFRSSFCKPSNSAPVPSLPPQRGGGTTHRGHYATLTSPVLRYPLPPAPVGRPYGARDIGSRPASPGSHYFTATAYRCPTRMIRSVGRYRHCRSSTKVRLVLSIPHCRAGITGTSTPVFCPTGNDGLTPSAECLVATLPRILALLVPRRRAYFALRATLSVFATLTHCLTATALTVPHDPRFPVICRSPTGRCAGVEPRSHDVTLPRNMWDGGERGIATGAHVPLANFKTNLSPVQDQPPGDHISPCRGSHIAEKHSNQRISSSGAKAPSQPAHRPVFIFHVKTDKFSIPVYKSP